MAAGRRFDVGETVRTPDGKLGRIVRPTPVAVVPYGLAAQREFQYYSMDDKADVVVYTVLVEGGELRYFTFDALIESSGAIRGDAS